MTAIQMGILDALNERGMDIMCASKYGEPGYTTDKPILLADWNNLNQSELNAVERYFEIEWEDEWVTDERGRAFRTHADCWFWQPSYTIIDGEVVGMDEVVKDSDSLLEWIENHYVGKTKAAVNSAAVTDDLLVEAGCKILVDGQENGLHAHMTDTPEKCLALAEPEGKWFFRISKVSQFYITFQLWQLPEEMKG